MENWTQEERAACEKAVYYLQFSGRTESELRKKLAGCGFSPASVDSAILYVTKRHYLDDREYARRFIERNQQKKSKKQMQYELSLKGISRDVLDEAFEESDLDEEKVIRAILEKRGYSHREADLKERQKMAAYLARKGFSYEAAASAMADT